MSYSTSGISGLRTHEYDGGIIVSCRSTHTDKIVQCYVNGALTAWQQSPGQTPRFDLQGWSDTDLVFLLAVDVDNAQTDYWDDAFGVASTYGNRIRIQTPQLLCYEPRALWKVCLGDAGDESASTLVHTEAFYPGGRRCGGFGFHFGYGGFGWDGYDAAGFGYNFGYGEFGFDCEMLTYESGPKTPGVYPYKVTISDAAGNESSGTTGTVTLSTYARPASDLSITSYDKTTDELALSFTASPDL